MQIKNRFTDAVIFEGDYPTIANCVKAAYAGGADLRSADLRSADLSGADLSGADLRSADLRSADLRSADLRSADLRSADLDYAAIPLWCGFQGAKIDARLARQFVAHALAFDCDEPWYLALREAALAECKQSHIADYINWLKDQAENA